VKPERFVDTYLGYLLGQANHALFKAFEDQVREAGLGSLEWRVLAVLSSESPMSVGQLAQEVLSQQPTVTKLLQRLAAQGWVSLHDDPADQRRTLVTSPWPGSARWPHCCAVPPSTNRMRWPSCRPPMCSG
jgi:MarR family transcriptional regulator, lower aerobic nicotinate degradation pathway regulator